MPITSGKFNTSAAYPDGIEICDYVHKKYCKSRKLYAYGASLGAVQLGMQLIT
jgi:hypothetical protein